jgi:hypothetical protein
MRYFAGLIAFGFAATSLSVAPGLPTDTHTSDFGCVGFFGGASAVLVGPDLILTAKHVSGLSVNFPGLGTFSAINGTVREHPTDDLKLFRINTGSITLSNYAQINTASVAANTGVTMVGFGGSGSVNLAGTGYDIYIGAGTRRKASAIVEGKVYVEEPGVLKLHSLYAPLRTNGQGALVGGDSGGGWFLNDGSARPQLVGINSWIGTFGTYNSNFTFSNDPNNFFASGAADLSAYNGWLVQNGASVVPEPGTLTALAVGSLLAIRRRRRTS